MALNPRGMHGFGQAAGREVLLFLLRDARDKLRAPRWTWGHHRHPTSITAPISLCTGSGVALLILLSALMDIQGNQNYIFQWVC